ncbi:MAG: hypothetical protein HY319_21320 [Armatimonadetes bacterium]|nr:hypothetical protein [Armatimonadota bacterium]
MRKWPTATLILVLGAFVTGILTSHTIFLRRLEAAPADVIGSPNVAVCGYKTNAGSFVLYSDGRIVELPSDVGGVPQVVVENAQTPGEYLDAPSNFAPLTVEQRSQGSPNVAVGVMPTKAATYVLFANGSVKRPKHDAAAQAPPGELVSGYVTGVDARVSGCTITFPWGNRQQGAAVTFDTPFDSTPAVTATAISGEGTVSVLELTATGFKVYANYGSSPSPQAGYSWVVSSTEKSSP